jgi:O-antigen/teichoic acid export membrane protein
MEAIGSQQHCDCWSGGTPAKFVMRTVLQNLASVIGGEAAVRAANFAAALFIARAFGGFALGAYAASLAVVTVVVMIADNGLQTFVITELAGRPSERESIIGEVYLYKTILLAVVIALLGAVAGLLGLSTFLWGVGSWVAARTILQSYSQLQMAALKSLSKTNAIGVIQVTHSLVLLAGIGTALFRHWTIFSLLAWLTACQLFEFALTVFTLLGAGVRPSCPPTLRFWDSMRKSAPFGIASGLANLIVRSDTVVLSTLVPLSVLGTFSAPNSVLLIVYVAAWLVGSVLLPEMVLLSATEEGLRHYFRKWTRLLILTSLPAAVIAFLAAPKFILLLFGASFERSGAPASIMALACPFILLNSVYTNFAIALNRRAVFTGLYAGMAVVALGLNLVLGRAFGPIGIADAIVIREAGMLAGFWILMSRKPSQARQSGSPVSSLSDVRVSEKPNLSSSLA